MSIFRLVFEAFFTRYCRLLRLGRLPCGGELWLLLALFVAPGFLLLLQAILEICCSLFTDASLMRCLYRAVKLLLFVRLLLLLLLCNCCSCCSCATVAPVQSFLVAPGDSCIAVAPAVSYHFVVAPLLGAAKSLVAP